MLNFVVFKNCESGGERRVLTCGCRRRKKGQELPINSGRLTNCIPKLQKTWLGGSKSYTGGTTSREFRWRRILRWRFIYGMRPARTEWPQFVQTCRAKKVLLGDIGAFETEIVLQVQAERLDFTRLPSTNLAKIFCGICCDCYIETTFAGSPQ